MNRHTRAKPVRLLVSIFIMMLACNGPISITATPIVPTTATNTPKVPLKPEPGPSGLSDSLYPGFGNGGYDVQHYTLDITVSDVSTSNLSAVMVGCGDQILASSDSISSPQWLRAQGPHPCAGHTCHHRRSFRRVEWAARTPRRLRAPSCRHA